MTTTHLILRWAHISMGVVGIASGAAAMSLRKGSVLHRRSGNVFFVSMLIMSAAGTILSIFMTPNRGNVMGGSLTFYLVATAWVTVVRKAGTIGRFEIVGALLGLAVATAGYTFGIEATNSPDHRFDGYRPPLYFIFGSVAMFATLLDFRMIWRRGLAGVQRTTRHLWRMSVAMFIATSSLFLGQPQVFPMALRHSGLLRVPVFLVIGALFYQLIRVRVWPLIRWIARRRLARIDPGFSIRST